MAGQPYQGTSSVQHRGQTPVKKKPQEPLEPGMGLIEPEKPKKGLPPGEQLAYLDAQAGSLLEQELEGRRTAGQTHLANTAASFTSPIQGPATSVRQNLENQLAGGNSLNFNQTPLATSRFGSMQPRSGPYGGVSAESGEVAKGAPAPVQTAASAAAAALGPAPTVDMGLADRNLGKLDESLAANKEVLDKALAGPDQSGSRAVLDELLNGESTAQRLGAQTLKAQLAMAKSAAGGPGAVADAFLNAQNTAPEIQAQATQQAVAERQQRLTAAGGVASGISATENEATSIAGNVGANITNAELGRRQQDVQIAQKNTDAATTVLGEVSRLTGTQLELDQRNKELIGQMARDMAAQDFNWAQLSAQQQDAYFNRLVQTYGIDKNFEAQIKAIAAQKSIGAIDVFNGVMGLVGGAATVGAAALGKPPV